MSLITSVQSEYVTRVMPRNIEYIMDGRASLVFVERLIKITKENAVKRERA